MLTAIDSVPNEKHSMSDELAADMWYNLYLWCSSTKVLLLARVHAQHCSQQAVQPENGCQIASDDMQTLSPTAPLDLSHTANCQALKSKFVISMLSNN